MKHIIGNLFLSSFFYIIFLRIGIAVARAKTISTNYEWYSTILFLFIGIDFIRYIYNNISQWYLPVIIIVIGIFTLNYKGMYITPKNVIGYLILRTIAMILSVHFLYNL